MPIKRLRAFPVKPEPIREYIQCEYPVKGTGHIIGWREKAYGPQGWRRVRDDWKHDLCQHLAVVRINGACYCRRHAAVIALDKWLAGELVEREHHK